MRATITLPEIEALPEVSSGSRRAGHALLAVLALRGVAADTIASLRIGELTITGAALRKDPEAFVLRRARKGQLQLRIPKEQQRIDNVSAIVVERVP